MKKIFTLFLPAVIILSTVVSCKKVAEGKNSNNTPKEELAVGHWNINRIQVKVFQNGIYVKDTIILQTPKPENFVQFDAGSSFQYRFNVSAIDAGSYLFMGSDSLIATTPSGIYRWKWITLTDVLFTVMSTATYQSMPGYTFENYQTFVK